MMNPLVSIVVPVYNVEKYLALCIESILSQTYPYLDIILVDDGSSDYSLEICKKYAKIDNRITVIHKKNGGVSSARNEGLTVVKGEYLCFVDSDDQLDSSGIENLLKGIVSNKCQYSVGMCGFVNSNLLKNEIKKEKVVDLSKSTSELLEYIVSDGSYSPYAKLYDAKIISDNEIMFREDMRMAEDSVFIRQYLMYCSKMCYVPHVVYKYNTDNENSLSKKSYRDYCVHYLKKLEALKELLEALQVDETTRIRFLSYRAVHGLQLSINHYLNNFFDEKVQKLLINESITLLSSWIKDFDAFENVKVDKWWKKYNKFIEQNDVDNLYKTIKIRHLINSFIFKIKLIIKRVYNRV